MLITLSEFPVLQVYFFELTSIEGVAKACHAASVTVSSVFVAGPINLIKVTGKQPSSTRGWLLADQLLEKRVFEVTSGWPIDGCELERSVVTGNGDCGRQEKRSSANVLNLNKVLIPQ